MASSCVGCTAITNGNPYCDVCNLVSQDRMDGYRLVALRCFDERVFRASIPNNTTWRFVTCNSRLFSADICGDYHEIGPPQVVFLVPGEKIVRAELEIRGLDVDVKKKQLLQLEAEAAELREEIDELERL